MSWKRHLTGRAGAFEVPLSTVGSLRLEPVPIRRAELVVLDLHGGEIRADGNQRPIRLVVRPKVVEPVLTAWGFVRSGEQRYTPGAS